MSKMSELLNINWNYCIYIYVFGRCIFHSMLVSANSHDQLVQEQNLLRELFHPCNNLLIQWNCECDFTFTLYSSYQFMHSVGIKPMTLDLLVSCSTTSSFRNAHIQSRSWSEYRNSILARVLWLTRQNKDFQRAV